MNIAGPHLFPRDEFPIKLEAFRCSDDVKIWEEIMEEPETLTSLYVPPLARLAGGPVWVKVTNAHGVEQVDRPEECP